MSADGLSTDQVEEPSAAEATVAGGDAVASTSPLSELEALREESARNYAGWQRAQADFENLKRRTAQDVRDRVQQSQRSILLDLLDLADDFERANREAPNEGANGDDPWREGVALISQKLHALLLRQQVQAIETVDQPFDPELHEAVGQLPGRASEIVAVLRTGYMIGSRVLRATQVMVGDGSVASDETSDGASNDVDQAKTTDEVK